MSARRSLLMTMLLAGTTAGIAYAQPYPPPGPPPDQPGYDQAYPDEGYQSDTIDQNYQDQGYYPDDDASAYNGQPVSVDYFYREMAPYGQWIQNPQYGWVWYPSHVPAGWRPYRYGRWVYTDYGWTWVSQEPFGWATYHYGRWTLDSQYGWVWVPGTDWGPAWVGWQEGNGYIGWAPLPPSVGFRAGIGLDLGGINLSVSLGPTWFNFVPERQFLAPSVSTYCLPPARNVTIIRNTRNITSYRMVNNRLINQSVPVQRVEQVTGQRVQQLRVAPVRTPGQGRGSRIQGNQVTVFQPRMSKARPTVTPQQAIAQRPRPTGRVAQPGQPGTPTPPRGIRTPVPTQPQTQQPATDQGTARYRRPTTAAEVRSRQDQERQNLAKQQADEQRQVEQLHQQEQVQSRNQPARAQEVKRNQDAEAKAMQQQQQRERQQLDAKHQREQQTVRGRDQQPPPKQQQPPPPKQQNQGSRKENNKDKPKDQQQDDRKPPALR